MRDLLLFASLTMAACGDGTDETHCFLADLDATAEIASVEVETTTGNEATDSDIYLVIELAGDVEQGLFIDDANDNFEEFATETFVIPVAQFAVEDVEHMHLRKDSSFLESGDWDLDGLTVTFIDTGDDRLLAYDFQGDVEHMTGDETFDMHCF